jgi:hypothetical protein
MSKSKFRPKHRRGAPSWFTNLFEIRPLRREFNMFIRSLVRGNQSELDRLEPRERAKPDYWD